MLTYADGPSGSGKSTIIGILLRFYDLLAGQVLIDGVEVKDWNLTHLRDHIGLVQQVNFNCALIAP
jgi:ABC-type multidrug transport system fused ATPase/permease subunit